MEESKEVIALNNQIIDNATIGQAPIYKSKTWLQLEIEHAKRQKERYRKIAIFYHDRAQISRPAERLSQDQMKAINEMAGPGLCISYGFIAKKLGLCKEYVHDYICARNEHIQDEQIKAISMPTSSDISNNGPEEQPA